MIGILLAAVVIPDFNAGRALAVLARDDETVAACKAERPSSLRAENVKLTLLSRGPELVLVEMYDDTCICGAHNCPFWIYRVRGPEDERLATSWAYSVKVVPAAGGVPDVVGTSHDSAAVSDVVRFAYRNGTYVEAESWKLRGDDRKPMSVPVHFAPGASSARLQGTIGLGWTDDYTVEAAKGQSFEVSAVAGKRATVFRLTGNGVDQKLTPGHPFILPASGTYTIDVDLADYGDDSDAGYSFTLSIR